MRINVRDLADATVDDHLNVAITVTNVDEAGSVMLPGSITSGIAATATLSDPDGSLSGISWQWSRGETASGTFNNISGATSNPYTPVAADAGKFLKATASYTDGHGSGKSATSAASSEVLSGNVDPSFSSMSTTRSVPENSADGTPVGAAVSATDGDNDPLEYSLSGTDASSFIIVANDGRILTKMGIIYDFESTKNSYSVIVNVSDKKDSAGLPDTVIDDSITVTINLTNADDPGTVTLPTEFTSWEEATATVSDPDGTVSNLTWQWSRGETPTGTFTPISGATSNTYTPMAADVGKYLKATASYTDPHGSGKSATSAASSQVVRGNVDPEFSSATATRSVAENSVSGTHVGAAVSATDGDGDMLTYSLSGTDASSFIIIADDGRILTRMGTTYDYESKNSYSVTVNVRDNLDSEVNADTSNDDSIAVTINLINVDEAGTVTIAGTELGGEALTASLTDLDGSVSGVTWRWARGNSAAGPFANISGATLNSYTLVSADVGKYVRATASYTDGQGSGKSANDVTGQIGAGNAEPTFDDGSSTTRVVAENSGAGTNVGSAVAATDDDGDTLTYSLAGTNASSFTIDSATGQIKTRSGITYNFEGTASYDVTVNVRDSKDNAGNSNTVNDDSISVAISLTDVNETPAITTTQTSISVAENQTSVLTYAATDMDNNGEANDSSNTLTWSVESADDGSFFEIDSSSGVLTFKYAPDFENKQDAGSDNVYNVTVTVTDNGIDGARGASNHLSVSKSLAVTVTDVNEAPTLTTAPGTASFDENGTGVVATYVATDPDATTGTMSWDLQGNDAGDFNITSTANGTAELTFKNPPDFEMPDDTGTNNVYDVTVRVRDDGSPRLEDTQTAAITVNDLNETPVIAGTAGPSFAEIEFDHTATASELVIGTYTATDDDNSDNANLQTIAFDVAGTDAAHFSIDASTGILSFSIEPDFENPADLADSTMMGASDNKYEIVVEADDGQGGTGEEESVGTFSVTVTVTNVNETPEIPAGVADESFAEIEFDADTADLDVMTYIPRDEETSTLTALSWSLAGTDAADFQITEDSTNGHGALSFRNRPNYEDPTDRVNTSESHVAGDNMYQVIVKISDGPNTRDYPLTVTVTNVDETPQFTVESSSWHADEIEYDSGTTAADLSSIPVTTANQAYWYRFEVRDEEGQDIIWSLTGPDAAYFVIDEDPDFVMTANADESAIARWAIVPDFEDPLGSSTLVPDHGYVFTVNASDGTNTRTHNVFIRIDDVNEQPEFTGTVTAALSLDEHDATLDASFQEPPYAFPVITTYTAYDEEGGVTWTLTGTDAGDFEIDSGGNVIFKETPNFEDPKDSGGDNVYNFTVVTTDVQSKTNRRTAMQPVTVTVRDIEETGVIQVSNLDPVVGDTITFTLSDPDGGIDTSQTNISWTLRARESGVWQPITIGSTASATLTYTVDEDDAGKPLRAEVAYFDRRNADRVFANRKSLTSGETSPVEADPLPNVPPRFRSGNSHAIEEGEAGRVLSERMTATDRDGDTLTFGIEDGQDSGLFEINPSTGQIRAIEVLDFETAGSEGLLFFTVTLHDGKGLDINDMVINDDSIDVTTVVSVRVIDVEEEGVLTLSDQEPEAGTPVTATLTDGDGGISGQTWQWARSEDGRTNWSNITGATNSSYTPTVNDEDFYLRATVTYTDRRGGGKRAEAIAGPVPSENRRPLFPSTETGQRTVEENARSGTNIGAPVAAVDPEGNSLTYTLTGADADAFTIMTATGQIRVASGTTLDFETKASYSVTVEVHDGRDGMGATSTVIDDTQAVTITVENVDEPGTVTLTSETQSIQARVPVTASLEDDDGPSNIGWQWSRSTNRSNWVNIGGATSDAFTPEDTDAGNYIRATATYNDGEGSGKTAEKVSPRVGQPPPVNSAPAFPATEDGRREVAENSSAGTAIGDPFVASDFNDDTLTYTLSGTDAALFTIDGNSGQLRVAQDDTLDFESKRTLRVTVEVTDGADSLGDPDSDAIDDRVNAIITLTDVNEAPEITGETSVSYQENGTSAIATYRGTDPERDTLTWSVDNDNFYITSGGQLYFAEPPNFEAAASHTVTITATDDDEDGNLSGTLTVTVTVTDEEEDGTVTIAPPRGWVDARTQFSAVLSDGDGGVTGLSWQWARSPNGRSGWSDIGGATSSSYTVGADDSGRYLRATASYTDRRSSNKTAAAILKSPVGETRPTTNSAPEFAAATTSRSVQEGASAGRNVGAPVRATDSDRGDVLTYSLGGVDADAFEIDSATGQIRTKVVLDRNVKDEYEVTVSVHDGFDSSYNISTLTDDTIDVAIAVTRRRPPPTPSPPPPPPPRNTAPVFTEGDETTRSVSEEAEVGANVGDPVSATDANRDTLTYELAGDDSGSFDIDASTGQLTTKVVLDASTKSTYAVEVTATDPSNAADTITVTITVTAAYDCVGGGAVADANNTGLVSDCLALLKARDEMAGSASLNWADDVPINEWDGITLRGTPERVVWLDMRARGLDGSIPVELGSLSGLTYLNLRSNDLTGTIPAELGDLANLRLMNLHSNNLSGDIPDLSSTMLEELYLANNADYNDDGSKVDGSGLTGQIPTWLNGMTNMRELWLWGNSLTGAVPDLSGMTSLDKLKLANNDLTGGVPQASQLPPNMTWLIIDRNPFGGTIPDLSSLTRLRLLWLHSNELTGSIPAGNNFPASLDDLNLRDNMLTGTIPDLSNLDNLTRLRLHNNSLSGEVPATLGGLDSLKYLWLHNEDAAKTSNGNNAFTSIAAGVGDLADTLIVIALSGNPWDVDACVPAELANVATNDYTEAGINICSSNDSS